MNEIKLKALSFRRRFLVNPSSHVESTVCPILHVVNPSYFVLPLLLYI